MAIRSLDVEARSDAWEQFQYKHLSKWNNKKALGIYLSGLFLESQKFVNSAMDIGLDRGNGLR